MNFKFTEDEQSIVDMISQYAAEKVAPRAHDVDEKEEFPVETWKELADMGMFGIAFDTAYEGQGMSFLTYAVVCEKLAEVCGTTSVMVAAHTSLCAWPISYYGTEEQKKKYLTELASGRKLGAFGLTEPNAGSDAGGTETTAVDKGDHWLLNGSKIFITNAGYAEIFVVFAATDKSKGTRGGITAFIVEKGDAGFTVGPH
ncbi:MAG: acyl-CoA dehydrogenase family protein, partial [Spirochaetaceae bacterium]|nr:acyl-CoA dehydrogenase family protein [Spirochaetaceae bacterium]